MRRRWVLAVAVVVGGCGGDGGADADVAICEAVASVGPGADEADARRAVTRIREAGRPDAPLLRDVQDQVFAEGDQLALPVPSLEALASVCEDAGADVSLPRTPE